MSLSKIENKWSKLWFERMIAKDNVSWSEISITPFLTMEIINDNPDKPWRWGEISRNRFLTMEILKDNPDKPWDWNAMTYNPNLTEEIVIEYSDKPFDWLMISKHPYLMKEMKHYKDVMCYDGRNYYEMKYDRKNDINQLMKMVLLLKLYYFYDTNVAHKMKHIEIIFYDIYLAKQIMIY